MTFSALAYATWLFRRQAKNASPESKASGRRLKTPHMFSYVEERIARLLRRVMGTHPSLEHRNMGTDRHRAAVAVIFEIRERRRIAETTA